ncbi:cellulase [Sulfolobus acidocaldarius SUSAZ]|nr:cellulase [Sulfolobus acidocaldarius SUSAZ]
MKFRLIVVLSTIILLVFTLVSIFIVLSHYQSRNDYIITLGNSYGGKFSILGNYQSDSAYAMGMVYSKNASLFISPFLWNLKSASGYTNLTYMGNILLVNVNFTNFEKINSNLQVDGYPGVMYGKEDWFPFAGKTLMPSYFVLPMRVISLPNFNSTLSYKTYDNKGIIDDLSYDIWLTQSPNTTYLLFPDMEIMIWLYYNETLSQYFVKAGVIRESIVVNGTMIQDNFTVYILPHTGSVNGWIGVYYISQLELPAGNVTIPMSSLIKDSFNYVRGVFPDLQTSAYYLCAIQVGMEFNDIHGVVNVGYTLYNWTMTIQDEM